MHVLAVLRGVPHWLLALTAAIVVSAMSVGPSLAADTPGAVYTETNSVPNYVQVFNRAADGTLTLGPRVATGANGRPAANPPEGLPFLDTAGAVNLSDNGRLLFVVNAGSNSISSFRVKSDGLELADVKPSSGLRPISLTSYNSKLLYVLNSNFGSASIAGYYVSSTGIMTPIPGSVGPTPNPSSLPAQITFSAYGDVLAVSERFAGPQGDLVTYKVDANGVAGSPVVHPSTGRTPYGIAFDQRDQMIVSNEHVPTLFDSTVSSYAVSRSGDVTPIDLETTNSAAACWQVITNNSEFTYVTSPNSESVEAFRIMPDGSLVPVTPTSHVAQTPGIPLDDALSHDSKYLYVLEKVPNPVPPPFALTIIGEYKVNADGTLTPIGTSAPILEDSASGLAGW